MPTKKEYLNCKIGLTPQCPSISNPIMQNLMMPPKSSHDANYFSSPDLDRANALCSKCDFFTSNNKDV